MSFITFNIICMPWNLAISMSNEWAIITIDKSEIQYIYKLF